MEKTASPRQPWHPCSLTQKGAEGLPSTPDADSLTQPACRESLDSDLRYHYLRWMGQAPGMGAHAVLTTPPEEGLRALISPHPPRGETEAQLHEVTSLSCHHWHAAECASSPGSLWLGRETFYICHITSGIPALSLQAGNPCIKPLL